LGLTDGATTTAEALVEGHGPHVAVEVSLNGQEFSNNGRLFEYHEPIELGYLDPPNGPASGGTVVSVTLAEDLEGDLGDSNAFSFHSITAGALDAMADETPGHSTGYSRGYVHSNWADAYGDDAEAGLTGVTEPLVACRFDREFVVNATIVDGVSLSCVAPKLDRRLRRTLPAVVPVEISINGQDFTDSGLVYEYHADVEVISVDPRTGPIGGGTLVTISGANFGGMSYANGFADGGSGGLFETAAPVVDVQEISVTGATGGYYTLEFNGKYCDISYLWHGAQKAQVLQELRKVGLKGTHQSEIQDITAQALEGYYTLEWTNANTGEVFKCGENKTATATYAENKDFRGCAKIMYYWNETHKDLFLRELDKIGLGDADATFHSTTSVHDPATYSRNQGIDTLKREGPQYPKTPGLGTRTWSVTFTSFASAETGGNADQGRRFGGHPGNQH
jgi:hypothetical protein